MSTAKHNRCSHPHAPATWERDGSFVRTKHYSSQTIVSGLFNSIQRCEYCHEICHYDDELDGHDLVSHFLCNCDTAKSVSEATDDVTLLEEQLHYAKVRRDQLVDDALSSKECMLKKVELEISIKARQFGIDTLTSKF